CIRIRGRIKAKIILAAFVNLVRMARAEFPVGTGIAEIKGELPRLCLDLHRVGCWRLEIHSSPGILSERSQGQNLYSDKNQRSEDHRPCASGKPLYGCVRFPSRKTPNEPRQAELGSQEEEPRFDHRVLELFI